MLSPKTEVSIFEFDSLPAYLTTVFHARKAARRSFSLRAWAMRMGMKATDSGNLSRIISGQRELPKRLIQVFAQDLELGKTERAYFELLVAGREKVSPESLQQIRRCLLNSTAAESAEVEHPLIPPALTVPETM